MELSADFSFFEDGEAFVEPHVLPVLASDVVSCPGVADFVSGYIYLRLVSNYDGRGGKSQQRILHSSVREAGREY